jgi:ferredoxin
MIKKKQVMVMVKISIISAGLTEMDERLDYADKSQPIREHDYTVCMVCLEICPEGAILIESANQEWHEKAAGTRVMMKSTSVNPHAHD